VLRIPNNEVFRHFREICDYIDLRVKEAVDR